MAKTSLVADEEIISKIPEEALQNYKKIGHWPIFLYSFNTGMYTLEWRISHQALGLLSAFVGVL